MGTSSLGVFGILFLITLSTVVEKTKSFSNNAVEPTVRPIEDTKIRLQFCNFGFAISAPPDDNELLYKEYDEAEPKATCVVDDSQVDCSTASSRPFTPNHQLKPEVKLTGSLLLLQCNPGHKFISGFEYNILFCETDASGTPKWSGLSDICLPEKSEMKFHYLGEQSLAYCPERGSVVMKNNENNLYVIEKSGDSAIASLKCATDEKASVRVSKCDQAESPKLDNADKDTLMDKDLLIYTCKDDYEFLSGLEYALSECKTDSNDRVAWSGISDICVKECSMPRHCADILELGLTEEGQYKVSPSRDEDYGVFDVPCVLEPNKANHEGGWTYILQQDLENDINQNKKAYINGYGVTNPQAKSYFVGLQYLSELSEAVPEGLVLEVLVLDADQVTSFATYSNFSMGEKYSISRLGDYHGNAGNALCPYVNQSFVFPADDDTTGAFWWANGDQLSIIEAISGSFVTKGIWGSVEKKSGRKIVMRVRPTSYEAEEKKLCPPLIGVDPDSFPNTEFYIPLERYNGTVISWNCKGIYKEGEDGGPYTVAGTSICLTLTKGKETTMEWTPVPHLPCKPVCETKDYHVSEDYQHCIHFSKESANNIVEAAQKCLEANATLIPLTTEKNIDFAEIDTEYFTMHSYRGSKQNLDAMDPPKPTGSSFVLKDGQPDPDKCQNGWNDDCKQCTALKKTKVGEKYVYQYHFVHCKKPLRYGCQYPGVCPNDYKLKEGVCLKLLSASSSYDASNKCEEDGSALAFPTNNIRMNMLVEFITENFKWKEESVKEGMKFFIGLNNANGTWNPHGMPKLPDGANSLLGSDVTKPVRILLLNSSTNWDSTSFEAVYHHEEQENLKNGVCQYILPLDCNNKLPDVSDNMNREWTGSTHYGTKSIYRCWAGFFINSKLNQTQHELFCWGILGDWRMHTSHEIKKPKLDPCVKVKVCNMTKEMKALNHEKSSKETSFYLNETVTFNCKNGMKMEFTEGVTKDYSESLKLTCQQIVDKDGDGNYSLAPNTVPKCTICDSELKLINGTIQDYDKTKKYKIGDILKAKCYDGFGFDPLKDIQEIKCSEDGWPKLQSCHKVCSLDSLPAEGQNVLKPKLLYDIIGTKLFYNCTEGYYFVPVKDEDLVDTIVVECFDGGKWKTNQTSLSCAEFCTDPPPKDLVEGATHDKTSYSKLNEEVVYTCQNIGKNTVKVTCTSKGWSSPPENFNCSDCPGSPLDKPEDGITSWDGKAHSHNTSVTYTCDKGFLFGNKQKTMETKCQHGMWSEIKATDFKCTKIECLVDAPKKPADSTSSKESDIEILYICNSGFAFPDYSQTMLSVCNGTHWHNKTEINCIQVCKDDPPKAHMPNITSGFQGQRFEGDNVTYTCQNGVFLPKYVSETFVVTCTKGVWSVDSLPNCGKYQLIDLEPNYSVSGWPHDRVLCSFSRDLLRFT